jgi:hypothetical protein
MEGSERLQAVWSQRLRAQQFVSPNCETIDVP